MKPKSNTEAEAWAFLQECMGISQRDRENYPEWVDALISILAHHVQLKNDLQRIQAKEKRA